MRKINGSAPLGQIRKDDPPEDLIEKALRLHVEIALQEATCDLTIARATWRKHRELVESPVLPEPYWSFDNSDDAILTGRRE